MPKILEITYTLSIPREQFEKEFGAAAEEIAKVPGLLWKVWIHDGGRTGGGVYLFENGQALHAFLNGPLVALIRSHPAFSDFRVKEFDVLVGQSETTRGLVRGQGNS